PDHPGLLPHPAHVGRPAQLHGGRCAMMLLAVGCSHRTAPVELRERLAFDADRLQRALDDLVARYGCEAVIVSTCNRVELYLARPDTSVALDIELIAEFLAEFHQLSATQLQPHLYEHRGA